LIYLNNIFNKILSKYQNKKYQNKKLKLQIKSMIFNVPNIISGFRILVSPIFFAMVISKDINIAIFAFPLFLIGAISDYYDGWYARKYKVITKLGIFIDPLADKFLTLSAFIAFNYLEIIPIWMTIAITIRDFGTTFLRLFGESHDLPVTTSEIAKLKTFFQFVFIGYIGLAFFLMKIDIFLSPDFFNSVIYSMFTYYFMLLLTLFTIYTLFLYIKDNMLLINKLFGITTDSK